MERGRLYIVCGATGSGKSTLANGIVACKEYNFEKTPKYSTRRPRGLDDDVIHVDQIDIGDYPLAYVAMGNRYGLRFNEIREQLARGKNSVLVLTDIRAVRRLKSFFDEDAVTICVSSAIDPNRFLEVHGQRYEFSPSEADRRLMDLYFHRLKSATRLELWSEVYHCTRQVFESWQRSIPERESLEIRTRKVRDFQTRYIENMSLFDHLILNYREGHPEDMVKQLKTIVAAYKDKRVKKRPEKGPVLFVVAGASGCGKGLLAETLKIIAPSEVGVVTKHGKREPRKSGERNDGMIPIGPLGEFPPHFDITFQSHKTKNFRGISYAFSKQNIDDNLEKGKNQLLVANVLLNQGLLDRLNRFFPGRIVVLYVLRFEEEQKLERFQRARCKTPEEADARIEEMRRTYSAYIEGICNVDYVLMNTAYPEDLFDQMFRLLEYYNTSD